MFLYSHTELLMQEKGCSAVHLLNTLHSDVFNLSAVLTQIRSPPSTTALNHEPTAIYSTFVSVFICFYLFFSIRILLKDLIAPTPKNERKHPSPDHNTQENTDSPRGPGGIRDLRIACKYNYPTFLTSKTHDGGRAPAVVIEVCELEN